MDVEWTVEGCATFLAHALTQPDMVVLVSYKKKKIVAAIGGVVYPIIQPPHPLVVDEWMWWGEKRGAVKCLNALREWGRSRGATLIKYVLGEPGQSPTKFSETYRYEVL